MLSVPAWAWSSSEYRMACYTSVSLDSSYSHGRLLLKLVVLLGLGQATFCSDNQPQLFGYRPQDVVKNTQDEIFVVPAGSMVSLFLFGEHLTNETLVKFTTHHQSCSGADPDIIGGSTVAVPVVNETIGDIADDSEPLPTLEVSFPTSSKITYYFCVASQPAGTSFVHQGSEKWLRIIVEPRVLPLWLEIIFIIVLMLLSGLFSGLNLGLMALDPTTLKIIKQSGTKRQKGYAKRIYRVRRHGNYLLCTLLLGNVLVNSTLTILLDSVIGSGIYAVISSTLAIVIFGEIIPQAICSRHGLAIGAWTIWLTYIFMVLTFPISLPLSLLLNLILGKEIGAVYNREQLLKLLDVTQQHNDIEGDEVNIISGALAFKKKTAEDVMTKFEDVYLLSIDGVLDFMTMKEIYESGFSRIPVYEGNRQNIVGLLYVRDLAFVDPDDNIAIQKHLEFYTHDLQFFYNDTTLDEILQGFSEGKCHLGIVQEVVTQTEGDPFYKVVGAVTLEDIVEEILQREIVDETDRFVDNRTLKPRERRHIDVGDFMVPSKAAILSPQQRLAVYQFLSSGVKPFKEEYISHAILKGLLKKDVIVQNINYEEYKNSDNCIYSAGTPASFFLLVLEGCMHVQAGKDQIQFDGRAFSHFGSQALSSSLDNPHYEYIPDFTVRPATNCLVIIITQRQYLAARKATLFEREATAVSLDESSTKHSQSATSPNFDVFSEEWEIAKSGDIEHCRSTSSGLSSITKLLMKNNSHHVLKRVPSDKQELLGSGESFQSNSNSSNCNDSAVHATVERQRDSIQFPYFRDETGTDEMATYKSTAV